VVLDDLLRDYSCGIWLRRSPVANGCDRADEHDLCPALGVGAEIDGAARAGDVSVLERSDGLVEVDGPCVVDEDVDTPEKIVVDMRREPEVVLGEIGLQKGEFGEVGKHAAVFEAVAVADVGIGGAVQAVDLGHLRRIDEALEDVVSQRAGGACQHDDVVSRARRRWRCKMRD
jgi:hypothetical protein